MAIKQRALLKLNTTKHHILRAMSAGGAAALGEACRGLTEIRDLYREGLPRQSYAAYGEICDGLILAVRKMMEGGEADTQGDALVLCEELLEHIETETEKEKNFKKEVFFLPYKVSMWDSLESVWKAAHEDKEHCNAYVMPIPYADLNPNRSVAAWHCERDQFPKYVPTLDWQEVDLKAWHPDVIFYHNPYDDCNLVTSVESRYYSRNLKECADKLVYIPYAVEEEVQPGNQADEDAIAHRVLCPGIMNADVVIAQSEDMRQAWINILTRRTNINDRAYWEKRILGLGSPKIDKVLTSRREDFDLPEKWEKLIAGKKVILYNTSIGAMLQNTDKVCDKLRYVFDVFRNRDDVVLWWRPHPLMKSTFHSMRPQFEEEYLGLEKQYIEEGWGIYDDSPDLHRAICWSDGYYGDYSSVLVLYWESRKPILIGKMRSLGCSYNPLYLADNIVCDDSDIWYIAINTNMIIRVNRNNGETCVCATIPKYKGLAEAYRAIVKYRDLLILIPYQAREICEYNVIRNDFKFYPLPKDTFTGEDRGLFSHMLVEDTLYMYGPCPIIVKFDLSTKEIRNISGWDVDFEAVILNKQFYFAENGFVMSEKKLALPAVANRMIILLDLMTEKMEYRLFQDIPEGELIDLVHPIDGEYWLCPRKSRKPTIMRFDSDLRKIGEVELDLGDKPLEYPFCCMEYSNGYVWLIPAFSDEGYKVDVNSLRVEKIHGLPCAGPRVLSRDGAYNYWCAHRETEEKLVMLHAYSQKIVTLDMLHGEIYTVDLHMSEEDKKALFEEKMSICTNSVIDERGFPLNEYVNFVGLMKELSCRREGIQEMGESIYSKVCCRI